MNRRERRNTEKRLGLHKHYKKETHKQKWERWESNQENGKRILEDKDLSIQFEEAKNLLESFRLGSLETHEVFDVDKLAKYFAINTLMGSTHSSFWNNIRFYYDPITSRLEPIGYDSLTGGNAYGLIDYSKKPGTLINLFFKDEVFYKNILKS